MCHYSLSFWTEFSKVLLCIFRFLIFNAVIKPKPEREEVTTLTLTVTYPPPNPTNTVFPSCFYYLYGKQNTTHQTSFDHTHCCSPFSIF